MNVPGPDVSSLIYGFSRPLYSTWVYYKPDNLLIDCGEGCATRMGNSAFGIDKILLTHGHNDHISGLSSIIWSRASAMGDKTKPLTIYYPKAEPLIISLRRYLASVQRNLPFKMEWIEIDAGDTIPLSSNRFIDTFQTKHIRNSLSLGYAISEKRRRLHVKYIGLEPYQLKDLASEGVTINEEYIAKLITFGGDGVPLNPDVVKGSEILMHEATIVDSAELKGQSHSTLDAAIKVAVEVRPKALVLYHISSRYSLEDIQKRIKKCVSYYTDSTPITFPIWCLYNGKILQIYTPK